MKTHKEFVTVTHVIRTEKRACSFGEMHKVSIYAEKHLTLTEMIRINDVLGYGDSERENPVYVDRQGRLYDTRIPVDYYGSKWYVRRDDNSGWSTRPIRGIKIRYDDVDSDDPATWPSVG